MRFICEACASGDHGSCPGSTHCDCQHRVKGGHRRAWWWRRRLGFAS